MFGHERGSRAPPPPVLCLLTPERAQERRQAAGVVALWARGGAALWMGTTVMRKAMKTMGYASITQGWQRYQFCIGRYPIPWYPIAVETETNIFNAIG